MEGYGNLSSLMATDREFAIYRKFGALNSQNLLYYQAELLALEDDLKEVAAKNRRSQDADKRLFGDNWFELSNAEPGKDSQWRKVLQIRKLLKEYNECLIQQVTLSKLEQPSTYNLKMLRRWLNNSEFGNRFLFGLEKSTWEDAHEHDLVAIPRPDSELHTDPLTRLIMGPALELFHDMVGHLYKKPSAGDTQGNHRMIRYKNSTILMLANLAVTVLSSALPIASIVALYYIDRMIVRLGVVAAFTMAFSLILATVTNARRAEIFASTAAFAAVQVVFIGTTTNGIQGTPGAT